MKKYQMAACAALSAMMLAACGNESTQGQEKAQNDTAQSTGTKVITDQLGREITIPKDISRVAMGGILPYYSTWYVATNSTKEIVGMHPNSYIAAQTSVLADISSDVLKADTSYIQNGEVNIEELLKLGPQIYFEGANEEVINKITEAGIPTIGINAVQVADAEPLSTFNSWLELTGQIIGTDERVNLFLNKGKAVQQELDIKLAHLSAENKPKVLFIYQLSDQIITITGAKHFSSQWAAATGAVNVAEKDVQGNKEVNMEQIYKWNPDIIYLTNFNQMQPNDLIENTISGQDWSQVNAVQEKKVYKVPLGIYRWTPPNGDAPLMLKWLAQKNHPDLFTYDMQEEIKSYYAEFYNYQLTDKQTEKILHPTYNDAGQ